MDIVNTLNYRITKKNNQVNNYLKENDPMSIEINIQKIYPLDYHEIIDSTIYDVFTINEFEEKNTNLYPLQ